MTVRDYEFECAGLKPNMKPKTNWTELDTVFGDIVFQELGLEVRLLCLFSLLSECFRGSEDDLHVILAPPGIIRCHSSF